jgi:NitT/TauT family transport system permease protein
MKKGGLIGVLTVIFIWFIITYAKIIDPFFLPGPIEVIFNLAQLILSGTLNQDIIMTLYRITLAFSISALIGIPLGLIIGFSQKMHELTEILIDFVRSTPASAVFPLFLLVFGVDDKSKIAVAVFCISAIIIFNTAQGVRNSKKSRIDAARLMGATDFVIFKDILIYESLPQILAGLRISISLVLILIILTEMFIGTQFGIGRRIIDYQYTYTIVSLYATISLAGVLGYLLNQVFAQMETKVVHWNGK